MAICIFVFFPERTQSWLSVVTLNICHIVFFFLFLLLYSIASAIARSNSNNHQITFFRENAANCNRDIKRIKTNYPATLHIVRVVRFAFDCWRFDCMCCSTKERIALKKKTGWKKQKKTKIKFQNSVFLPAAAAQNMQREWRLSFRQLQLKFNRNRQAKNGRNQTQLINTTAAEQSPTSFV